jgi:penicillin-binding protein 1A
MLKWLVRLFIVMMLGAVLGVASLIGIYFYIKPQLPDVSALRDVKLATPMKVYSRDGELISQFGEIRRIPLRLDEIPQSMIDAVLATEDARFYEHPGIDPIGIIRAATVWAVSGQARQGASTITQQVARNFFLSNEKTLVRKIKEVFLAWRIEQNLSKDEILTLYLNKIPLGYRAFGVGAAAQVYFGKEVKDLTLDEIAIIAGLPKAPSMLNPIRSPERAFARRNVVLGRMLETGKITQAQYDEASKMPVKARFHGAETTLNAPYLSEMVRQKMVEQFGEDAYTMGLHVYTTVTAKRQRAAHQALLDTEETKELDEAAKAIDPFGYYENSGDHYAKHTIQLWDIIREYELDYFEGNALKYLLRQKGDRLEDLQKAARYIEECIKNEQERIDNI